MSVRSHTCKLALALGICLFSLTPGTAQEGEKQDRRLTQRDAWKMYEVYVATSFADGLTDGELEMLINLAVKCKLSPDDIDPVIQKLAKFKGLNEWTPSLPKSEELQTEMVYCQFKLILADGEVSDSEEMIGALVRKQLTMSESKYVELLKKARDESR